MKRVAQTPDHDNSMRARFDGAGVSEYVPFRLRWLLESEELRSGGQDDGTPFTKAIPER